MMLYVLVPGLAVWMLFCGYAGYHRRFGLALIVVAIGMGLNMLWMMLGLDAKRAVASRADGPCGGGVLRNFGCGNGLFDRASGSGLSRKQGRAS